MAKKDWSFCALTQIRYKAEIRYEGTEGREQYPHICGCLNVDAVFNVFDFEPKDGKFELPKEVVDIVWQNVCRSFVDFTVKSTMD